MPDGTVPSSTEALRAALSAARASLERQLRTTRTDAAEDALRQVKSALRLLPSERICDIPEIEWVEADPSVGGSSANAAQGALAAPLAKTEIAAPDTPRPADDLTRIRGIDDVLSKRLAALGIQRYAQIAAWQPDDVRAIADAMGLGRRFLAMGIVEQAIDLDRAQAEARLKDQQAPVSPTLEGRHSVAIWEPKASAALDISSPLVRAPAAWKPLDGDALAAVLKIIRTKRPMNRIVHLGDVAPVLTQPIYIATDYDAATELPRWRTGVLVPFVEAREAPDLLQLARAAKPARQAETAASHHVARSAHETPSAWPAAATRDAMPLARATQPSEAANAIAAFHAAVATTPAPAPTKVQPLHEQASSRIDDLEAELERLAQQSDSPTRADSAPAVLTEAELAQVLAAHSVQAEAPRTPRSNRAAEPPADHVAPAMFGSRDDVPEADVKILVRTKAPLLAPLPDLPLTARSRARVRPDDDMSEDARQSYGRVEEAAVVIVRRATAEPAAAGLAFYAQARAERASGPVSSNPVRRFMRALAGG